MSISCNRSHERGTWFSNADMPVFGKAVAGRVLDFAVPSQLDHEGRLIPAVIVGSGLPALRLPIATLINADSVPDATAVIARCHRFADGNGGGMIVTIIPGARPGLAQFASHEAAAILWAFTRQAALDWAPRKIRVNAISFGHAPFGPDEAAEQAARVAATIRAVPAVQDDLISTLRLIAKLPSMTGQLIRLGA